MQRRKTILAAALALPFMFGNSLEVQANGEHGDKDVLLQFEFGEYRYPEPAWAAGGISCKGGWRIVGNRFYDVTVLECSGRTFTYLARHRKETFRVFVDSRTGRILGVAAA